MGTISLRVSSNSNTYTYKHTNTKKHTHTHTHTHTHAHSHASTHTTTHAPKHAYTRTLTYTLWIQPSNGIHTVSHHCLEGPNFKILALIVDCRLAMSDAINDLVGKMRWRSKSRLRVKKYHTVTNMINLYKAKVLSYAKYRTAAIYHSCTSNWDAFDRIQCTLLNEIKMNKIIAFSNFKLAPLNLRRNIPMLRIIDKRSWKKLQYNYNDFSTQHPPQPEGAKATTP